MLPSTLGTTSSCRGLYYNRALCLRRRQGKRITSRREFLQVMPGVINRPFIHGEYLRWFVGNNYPNGPRNSTVKTGHSFLSNSFFLTRW